MDDAIWGMILGKSGKVPGPIAPELIELAESQGRQFVTDDPHTFYPDALAEFVDEMNAKGWERGQDDEELFELAMHPEQYRMYKSGKARENFESDLHKAVMAAQAPQAGPNERDKAAIAVALHLHEQSKHDNESGVLTRSYRATKWDGELNPRFQ